MVRLELEVDAVRFMINKLDQVGGTRALCNRLEVILMKQNEPLVPVVEEDTEDKVVPEEETPE